MGNDNQLTSNALFKNKTFLLSSGIFLFIIASLLISFATPLKFLLKFSHDDTYFYLKIANNIAIGLGSTFDGINKTNGYHPLWLIIVAGLYFVIHQFINPEPEFLLRATSFLQLIMAGAISLILYKIYKILYGEHNFIQKIVLLLMICFIFVFTHDWGLESNLACLILAAIVYVKTLEIFNNQNYLKLKILLLILLLLARIDYPYTIIPLIILVDYFTANDKFRLKNLIIISITISFVLVLYCLYNYLNYGSIFTISSVTISRYPKITPIENITVLLHPEYFLNYGVKIILFMFVIAIYPFIRKRYWAEQLQVKYNLFIWGLCFGSFLLVISYLVFAAGIREWYLTVPAFCSALLFVRYLDSFKRLVKFLIILFIILGSGYFYIARIENSVYGNAYDYSQQIKHSLPENSRILMGNKSGLVAFFSDRKFINGDGLVNSFEYFNMLKAGRISEYIKKYDIEYYCTFTGGFKSDSSDIFIDVMYPVSVNINAYSFRFHKDDLVFSYPYTTHHISGDSFGEWYLFRFKN
jgi:hypothetical protein